MTNSAYIHIPFCKSKCKYCSFVSFTDTEYIEKYVNALLKEIDYNYKTELLKTLYFGGGTPSLLPIQFINKIIERFTIDNKTEITYEINPDDANFNYLKELKNLGINRLSFGVQTFDDKILNLIGRRHNSEQVFQAIENAKEAGFEHISVDLIYGLPEQTLESLEKDLKIINNLDIPHVSTYGLKIEKPSFYYYHPVSVPDSDMQADMYILINEYLNKTVLYRYEISNFSKKGYESKHNLNYWDNNEYYGLGVSAHGYENGIRYSNTENMAEYISNPCKHAQEHMVTDKERLEEEIFLGFRKESGININNINTKFGIDFNSKYKNIIDRYTPKYIVKTDTGYKLSTDGILLSNNILAEFIDI